MKKIKILELFAGSRSVWNEADKLWHETFSTDLTWYDKIDYQVNILEFDYEKIPFIPDMIWASPPCTTYSIASCWHHRNVDRSPKTDDAIIWDRIALKTLHIIAYYLKLNPKLKWYIENPRGILRKMPFMEDRWIRNTVTYCSYWDDRMKPTDIWTNNGSWIPKKMCKNYTYNSNWDIINKHCHHEWARRWARTWTQWRDNAHERSKIPEELCLEIINSININ